MDFLQLQDNSDDDDDNSDYFETTDEIDLVDDSPNKQYDYNSDSVETTVEIDLVDDAPNKQYVETTGESDLADDSPNKYQLRGWKCVACTFLNGISDKTCQMCQNGGPKEIEMSCVKPHVWVCAICTLENDADCALCSLCGKERGKTKNSESESESVQSLGEFSGDELLDTDDQEEEELDDDYDDLYVGKKDGISRDSRNIREPVALSPVQAPNAPFRGCNSLIKPTIYSVVDDDIEEFIDGDGHSKSNPFTKGTINSFPEFEHFRSVTDLLRNRETGLNFNDFMLNSSTTYKIGRRKVGNTSDGSEAMLQSFENRKNKRAVAETKAKNKPKKSFRKRKYYRKKK